MEVVLMGGNWFNIAKAEFQVQTSSMRKHRKRFVVGSYVGGLAWALFFAPLIMSSILIDYLQLPPSLLAMVMPGLMRAGIMFIWLMLLIIPLTNALQEVKIGQWEVLLSNRVSTREILFGSFLGRVAIYGLYVLYLTPLLLAPFAVAMEVSFLGLGLMSLNIFVLTVGTIWVSNLLVTAIQARLGSSSRGKDLANAVAILLGLVATIPLIGLQLFAPLMTEILGMDFFLIFPFSWSADLMTQIAVVFNGVGFSLSQFEALLGFDYIINLLLIGSFSGVTIAIGALTADRFFVIGETSRIEEVTRVQGENLFIRGIRRASVGSFGILVITGIKSFMRKAENISRLFLLIVLALIIPFFIFFRAGELDLTSVVIMTSLMLGFLGVQVFGGTGFIESKDQLWNIQAAPQGVRRFILSKVVQSLLFIVPIAFLPGILYSLLLNLALTDAILILLANIASCIGGSFIGIGIASINPTYDDTKSGSYRENNVRGMMLVVLSFMGYLLVDILVSMLGYHDFMNMLWESEFYSLLAQLVPLPLVGLAVLFVGQHSLAHRE